MGGWRALLASNTSLHRRPHGRCLLEWLAVWAGLAWAGLAGLGWPAGLSWLGGMGRLSWAGLGWLPLIEAPPIPRRAQKSVSGTTWVAIRNLKFIPGNSRMPLLRAPEAFGPPDMRSSTRCRSAALHEVFGATRHLASLYHAHRRRSHANTGPLPRARDMFSILEERSRKHFGPRAMCGKQICTF